MRPHVVELRRYLSILQARKWVIIVTVVLCAAAGYAIASKPAQYTARTTLYVGPRAIALDPSAGELSNDRASAIDRLVLTFSFMVDSDPIAARAAEELGIDRSAKQIVDATTASPEPATQLLYIDVADGDPKAAQDIANGLADAFVDAVQEFEPGDTEGAVPRLPAYVFQRASLPTAPEPTNTLQSVILAAAFGLLVSCGAVLLLDYLNVTIRTAADAERRLELPVLGVIPALGDDLPAERLHPPEPTPEELAEAAWRPSSREPSDA